MVLFYILFFILGSAVGSFLNVVCDRMPGGKSILGRSFCDHCGRRLDTFDLVPIVSFFAVGRRCRVCKKPISWQYPIVETLTGMLFLLSFWKLSGVGTLGVLTLLYLFFICSIGIIVAVYDFKSSLIPTSFVFLASLAALFFNYFYLDSGEFVGRVVAAFAAALFFGFIVLATRARGMGQGDAILAFLIGMVLGINESVLAIFLAFLSGALFAVFLLIVGKKRLGQTIPFGPFLILGFFISLFFANPIINFYLMLY